MGASSRGAEVDIKVIFFVFHMLPSRGACLSLASTIQAEEIQKLTHFSQKFRNYFLIY